MKIVTYECNGCSEIIDLGEVIRGSETMPENVHYCKSCGIKIMEYFKANI